MGKITLTKLEVNAIYDTAGQMKDDMSDYYSYMPKKERQKFIAAYNSAMEKLRAIMQNKTLTPTQQKKHNKLWGGLKND
jgi:hypothetical protein